MNEQTYYKYYKKLMLIPLILLILGLLILTRSQLQTGDIMIKDIGLKGGISATISLDQEPNIDELETKLHQTFPENKFVIRKLSVLGSDKIKGLILETDTFDELGLKSALENVLNLKLTYENYSYSITSSLIGQSFYSQMLKAILFTFFLMFLVITITYRTIIPSLAIIQAPFTNMVVTLAIINLLKIPVSISGISALLLAIGYSIDTDVLLTTKLLRRQDESTIYYRLISSLKTGLTMTFTAIAALLVGYIISNSPVLREMFLVLIICLSIDTISTYLMNAGLLIWYLERKK